MRDRTPRGPRWPRRCGLLAATASACLYLPAAPADDAAGPTRVAALPADLGQLSLDQLMNVEVTTVSKRPEPLSDSAAAVFVLSGEEIRRSGVHSIAEALRLVPGLQVAQVNAGSYAITARGFNSSSADKLQVLLDGRSVYTPLFSGVFWDTLDTYLNDIDRIEVIRGPGAALWGSNAVNGVINIITRSSADTQGAVAQAGAGNAEHVYGAARYGSSLGSGGSMRLYAQGYSRANSTLDSGADVRDGQQQQRAGFRTDWALPHDQALMVSGDGYSGREQTAVITAGGPPPAATTVSGANVQSRWSGHSATGSDWSLQAYYDGYTRHIPGAYQETRNTVDLDFQHGFRLGGSQQFLYGFGYDSSHDDTGGPPNVIIFDPPRRTLQTGNAFLQDQVNLSATTTLTVGSKFEYNNLTGFEAQPSVRIGWRALDDVFTWASVSRAVRTPNRLDEDVALYCPPPSGFPGVCGPGLLRIGNPDFRSEEMIAYEWGLRFWTRQNFSVDLSTFYNDYTRLRSSETTPPPIGSFQNKLEAHAFGSELSLLWRPIQALDVRAFYQTLQVHAHTVDGSTDKTGVPTLDGSDPRQQAGLRLSARPFDRWLFDTQLRYVDKLAYYHLPDYAELGARLAYTPVPRLELALIGQNLLHDRHPEWGAPASRAELRRSGMFQFTWYWNKP